MVEEVVMKRFKAINPFPYTEKQYTMPADDFCTHSWKRRAISPFATIFYALFNNYAFIWEWCHIFFKLSAADLLYVGKGYL